MSKSILLAIAASMFWQSPAIAQQISPACEVRIVSPVNYGRVGQTVDVSGTATIPLGTRMWVLAHRKGLAVWWPQGGGAVNIVANKWMVLTYIGEPRDIGSEFEVTARVFDEQGHQVLLNWVKKAADTGIYPGIPMPVSDSRCRANTVTVAKQR